MYFVILLLIKLMFKDQAWRKPINTMILFNQGVKFVCSVFVMMMCIVALIWMEVSRESGTSYMGIGSMCHSVYYLGTIGVLWNFLDGAG